VVVDASYQSGAQDGLLDECSTKSIRLYLIRKGHTATIRAALRERDGGVCNRCGLDTNRARNYWRDTLRLRGWLARRYFENRYPERGRLRNWLAGNTAALQGIQRDSGFNPNATFLGSTSQGSCN